MDVNAYPNNEETVSDEIDLSSMRQEIPVNNTNMRMPVKKKFFQLKFFRKSFMNERIQD